MSNVVSDTSPLIHLAAIGRLSLLREYYHSIIIPTAVWREVVEQGGDREGAKEIQTARAEGWITVASPKNAARNTATPPAYTGVTAPDGFPPGDAVPVVSRMTSET